MCVCMCVCVCAFVRLQQEVMEENMMKNKRGVLETREMTRRTSGLRRESMCEPPERGQVTVMATVKCL